MNDDEVQKLIARNAELESALAKRLEAPGETSKPEPVTRSMMRNQVWFFQHQNEVRAAMKAGTIIDDIDPATGRPVISREQMDAARRAGEASVAGRYPGGRKDNR